MKITIISRVRNRPGVVSRISGLFTRRGYNIDSLVTGTTADPSVYQLTVSMIGEPEDADLLARQLRRMPDVLEVRMSGDGDLVTSELMFIKVAAPPEKRIDVMNAAKLLGCRIASTSDDSVIWEVTGSEDALTAVIRAAEVFGIRDIIRSGVMGIVK